jgi:hypothetical protein
MLGRVPLILVATIDLAIVAGPVRSEWVPTYLRSATPGALVYRGSMHGRCKCWVGDDYGVWRHLEEGGSRREVEFGERVCVEMGLCVCVDDIFLSPGEVQS